MEQERDRLTDGITLPASAALTEARTVHHVALIVSLLKSLVHLVRLLIQHTLV